jgi:prepilin-type N-terminal cleavage/methylation domain-containing protein
VKQKVQNAAGFTLVEITLVLAVLAILALVLTPAVMNFINDARLTRAQADVRTLSNAVLEFNRTTGFYPKTSDSVSGGAGIAVVDMLVSGGNLPLAEVEAVGDAAQWSSGTYDHYENHLLNNVPNYRMRTTPGTMGWSGPYMQSAAVDADPWGNRYMINVIYLDSNVGSQTKLGELKNTVLAISAGPDGLMSTPFTQPVSQSAVQGDDIASRIQ